MKKPVLLDLFSGIGGFPKGLIEGGFKFKKHYFSEIDPFAIANYSYNFKNATYVGPIENIKKGTIQKPDIITFGSPCQDLSMAGKRKGIKGSKSRLFFEAIRILDLHKPRLFIFENVKGLFSSNQGKDFEIVLRSFANLGIYDIQWQLLNTSWFLPQNRERIYLVGSLRGTTRPQVFPIGESCQKTENCTRRKLSEANISSTIHTKVGDSYVKDNPYILTIRGGRNVKSGSKVEFRKDGNTNCLTGVPEDNLFYNNWIPLKSERTEKAKSIRKNHQKKGKDYAPFKEKQLVPRADGKTSAILSQGHQDNLITNLHCVRKLTTLECERLQGFPDHWTKYGIRDGKEIELSDSRRYQLIGNAVSVPVVKMVGIQLLKGISQNQNPVKNTDHNMFILQSKALKLQLLFLKS
ncbi:DNA cytosine methyltransferase [Aquimarina sp. Aq107]|uniref:DNA cytosine methyltransferase n=1 Tax=Aquimarina sp. Aq107 TaxID=1191912 RepID=UPI000D552A68|nr:DNA (cytosine-5-)-methyltransferase [Aquimarina sp. Aq107]